MPTLYLVARSVYFRDLQVIYGSVLCPVWLISSHCVLLRRSRRVRSEVVISEPLQLLLYKTLCVACFSVGVRST